MNQLQRSLNALPALEAQVIKLRYGLDTGRPMTAQQVADFLGTSARAVEAIEASALQRMRVESPVQLADTHPKQYGQNMSGVINTRS